MPTLCVWEVKLAVCERRRLENQLFEMQLSERDRGERDWWYQALATQGREGDGWMEGETEEGGDGDKQAMKIRECERVEGGGKAITPSLDTTA